MTREEQIQKLIDEETGIDNYGSSDYQIGVCDGVRLADKTILDRACEWLKSVLACGDDYIGDKVVIAYDYETVKEFTTAFRQAMEGGAE